MNVLMPLPSLDFDPTEVAVTWEILRDGGHAVRFATPDGRPARADTLMVTGRGLDPWGFVPGLARLRAMGAVLAAREDALRAYRALEGDAAFTAPLPYDALRADDFDALVLPGGHRAAGMTAYLESTTLASFVADMFDAGKPVSAICHGVVVAARARSKRTGRSALYGRKTTALTWRQERLAWTIGRFARFWDPHYTGRIARRRANRPATVASKPRSRASSRRRAIFSTLRRTTRAIGKRPMGACAIRATIRRRLSSCAMEPTCRRAGRATSTRLRRRSLTSSRNAKPFLRNARGGPLREPCEASPHGPVV